MFDIFQILIIVLIIAFISIALLWVDRLVSRFFGSPNKGLIWGQPLKWKMIVAFVLILAFIYGEIRLKSNNPTGYDLSLELIIGFCAFITMSIIFYRDKFFLLMASKSGELMDKVDAGEVNATEAIKTTYNNAKQNFDEIVEAAGEQLHEVKEHLPQFTQKDSEEIIEQKPEQSNDESSTLSPRERINKHLKK